jgi:predicted aldo/keto reductase-like oxidoreductase
MEYRKLGKTGMDVSVIGLGPEHLVGKPFAQVEEVVHRAMDGGVNIMDLFMPQEEVRTHLGMALQGRRDKMIIQGHIGSTLRNGQADISRDLPTCKAYFEALMKNLGTDYIDLGMLFYIDSEKDFKETFEGGLAEYARELKEKGIIRAIGASSHNPIMARRAVETGCLDMLMFSINPAFDLYPAEHNVFELFEKSGEENAANFGGVDPRRADLYRICEQRGVGITVMKTLGGGRLLSPENTPFSRPLTVGQCIHFALTRPAVASVLIGCTSGAQVDEALAYLALPDSARDYADAVAEYQRDFSGHCVYCNHCQPCPAGIDIAAATKFLDIARLSEEAIPDTIRQHYLGLDHKGGECIRCGSCEERCPFSVKVIENMEKAAALFGE